MATTAKPNCAFSIATCKAYHTYKYHILQNTCKYRPNCAFEVRDTDADKIADIIRHCENYRHRRIDGDVYRNIKSKLPDIPTSPDLSKRQVAAQLVAEHNADYTSRIVSTFNEVTEMIQKMDPPPMPIQKKRCIYVRPNAVYLYDKWWVLQCAEPPAGDWDMCDACYKLYLRDKARSERASR